MTFNAATVAPRPRVRRSRALLAAAAFVATGTTALLAGTMLASSDSPPLLMAVAGLDQQRPEAAVALANHEVDAPAHSDVPLHEPVASSGHALDFDDAEEIRWFNGRPIRPAGTMTMTVTAYSPDEQSCGIWADGITASGYSVWTNGMKLVAADTSVLPFGSLVSIPGYDDGAVVPVLDRGGAIKGKRLDVLYPTHERALQWGVQRLEVTIWEYADGKPNGFRQNHRRR